MTGSAEQAAIDLRLAGVLPEGSLFAVGGRVRDQLRSEIDGAPRVAKDLDYVATGLELDELVSRLARLGRANVVGASFAVVKVAVERSLVDVALPRRERSTGVGHRDFTVEWGPDVPLVEDLARRDFRMNMIARAIPSGALIDPYGGAADIAASRIDILSEAAFVEDPLRMLRACQFAARFEFAVSSRTFDAMRAAAALVASVSPERIRDELLKLLQARRPSLGLELMRESGLLTYVLPELTEGVGVEQNVYHAYDVYVHNLATLDATEIGDPLLRLAALLHDVGKPRTKDGPRFYGHELVGADLAAAVLGRLRFSHDEAQTVASLVRNHMYANDPGMTDAAVRRFVKRIGSDNLQRQFALRRADIVGSGLPKRGEANEAFEARVATLLAAIPPLNVADLAIGGDDVIAAAIRHGRLAPGSRGGAVVGTVLRELLDDVLEDPRKNERTLLLDAIDAILSRDVPRETTTPRDQRLE